MRRSDYSQPLTIFGLDIPRGVYPIAKALGKFGVNLDIDSGDASHEHPVTVWEFGREFGNAANPQYLYLPRNGQADPIDSMSSSSAGDDGLIIEVHGLNFDGEAVVQNVVLAGQAKIALATPLWRVFRMINITTEPVTGLGPDVVGTIYCYQGTGSAITAGVPDDPQRVKAIINNGHNQSLMTVYTIPKGKVGYLAKLEAGVARGSADVSIGIVYRTRVVGGAMTVKKAFSVTSHGTADFSDTRTFFGKLPELTDIEISVNSVSRDHATVWAAFDVLLINIPEG